MCFYLVRHPVEIPWREFSANVFKAGSQALPVSALVGFLIGVTNQLPLRPAAEDLRGGPLHRQYPRHLHHPGNSARCWWRCWWPAVSGSAITAQIGVMRVTEEIDALATMGISRTLRIVLPKVVALSVAMPLLVLWTSAVALIGGMLAAYMQLDLSPAYFIDNLPKAVPVANVLIGLGKGVVFGFCIALVASHFGPPRQAQYREPVRPHDHGGGGLHHHGDRRRCALRRGHQVHRDARAMTGSVPRHPARRGVDPLQGCGHPQGPRPDHRRR